MASPSAQRRATAVNTSRAAVARSGSGAPASARAQGSTERTSSRSWPFIPASMRRSVPSRSSVSQCAAHSGVRSGGAMPSRSPAAASAGVGVSSNNISAAPPDPVR
ncbi:hypothetical protein [Crossiella sp. CA198]|uniref:hypothetical protein n=1 Tax=Crossiella sp. CA198 TaxID=3455607 RepID=UPI003F8D65A1